ncbi:MAG: carboxypeptidase regulatory-like domain-containing protein [Acidobacteria bacterium]|nr:carboxypeptidase regulatory-like domain-containing protein [Acidobacteriota bacterium]
MTRRIAVLAVGLLLAAAGLSAKSADFPGRVFDAATKDGIQNLQVKLTPPRQVKAPIRIASSERDGSFVFTRLAPGRYLVEVSQGPTLLYRAEVDTTKVTRLDVPLRRR